MVFLVDFFPKIHEDSKVIIVAKISSPEHLRDVREEWRIHRCHGRDKIRATDANCYQSKGRSTIFTMAEFKSARHHNDRQFKMDEFRNQPAEINRLRVEMKHSIRGKISLCNAVQIRTFAFRVEDLSTATL